MDNKGFEVVKLANVFIFECGNAIFGLKAPVAQRLEQRPCKVKARKP